MISYELLTKFNVFPRESKNYNFILKFVLSFSVFVSILVISSSIVNAGSLGTPVSITNNGFESGNLTGWTSTVSSWITGITGSITADNTTSSSGSYSAKIVLDNAGPGYSGYSSLTQSVTLASNTYYQFSLDIKGTSYYFLDIANSGSTIIKRLVDTTGVSTDSWRTLKYNFKTPASAETWTINVRISGLSPGQTGTIYLDNIAITPIITLDKSEFTVGAIGDSQVSHLGLSTVFENDNVSSWLSSSIRKAQINNIIVTPPLNKGIAGNTAAQTAARVQADIVDQVPKPEICYVAVGTNDAAGSNDITAFKNSITSTITTLKNGNVRPVLFKITPRKDAVNITPYNTAISQVASEQNITLFDPTPVFTAYSTWQTDWMDDNVHYNQYGHLAIGTSLGSYLDDFIASPSAFTPTSNTNATTNNTTPTITFSTTDNVAVDHYTVQADSGSESTQTSPYTLPVLTEGSHSVTVRAYDALWNITSGTALNLTIDTTVPTTPNDLAITSATNNSKPTLNWTASTDSGSGLANPAYTLQWSTDSSFAIDVNSATTNTNSYTLTSDLRDATWYFRVKATDVAGNDSAYSTANITINTINPNTTATSCSSSTPSGIVPWLNTALSNSSNSVNLQFVNYQSPVDKYVLEYGTKSGEYKYSVDNIDKNSKEFLVGGLSPNTTYYFRIRTGNGCAVGTWSNEISVKTKSNFEVSNLDITDSEIKTTPLDTKPKTTKDTKPEEFKGYEVNIKVLDTSEQPVLGAKVTLHSDPKEATTDENGIAHFTDVERGDHKVLIAYKNFEGEQSINLTGEVKQFDINVTVDEKKFSISPFAWWIIGGMGILIIYLVIKLRKNKNIKRII